MGLVAFTAASIEWGFNDLTSLSGTTVSAWRTVSASLAASLAIYAWPMAAIAACRPLPVDRDSATARPRWSER